MTARQLANRTSPRLPMSRITPRGIGIDLALRQLSATVGLLLATSVASAQFGGERFQMSEEQLISWAFQNQSSIDAAQQHAREELQGQIEFIAVIGTLTTEQRQRLTLAGEGDIHRFFADAQRVIARQPTGQLDQDQWNKVWQQLSPIRERFSQGLTTEQSLFRKTIRSALSAEQWEQYQQLVTDREQRNYRLLVQAAIAELEIKVPLTRRQRTQLIDLLATKTKPPRVRPNPYQQYIFVMYRMSELNEAELRPIFEESEFRVVKQILDNARGYRGQFEVEQRGVVGGFLNILF